VSPITDGTNWFTVELIPGQSVVATPVTGLIVEPQGYLTLQSDTNNIITSSDTTAATTVYYSPLRGNFIPIYNGTKWVLYTFSQLSLTLVSNHLADSLYDIFAFIISGPVDIRSHDDRRWEFSASLPCRSGSMASSGGRWATASNG
jgi:hypothetical protein